MEREKLAAETQDEGELPHCAAYALPYALLYALPYFADTLPTIRACS